MLSVYAQSFNTGLTAKMAQMPLKSISVKTKIYRHVVHAPPIHSKNQLSNYECLITEKNLDVRNKAADQEQEIMAIA